MQSMKYIALHSAHTLNSGCRKWHILTCNVLIWHMGTQSKRRKLLRALLDRLILHATCLTQVSTRKHHYMYTYKGHCTLNVRRYSKISQCEYLDLSIVGITLFLLNRVCSNFCSLRTLMDTLGMPSNLKIVRLNEVQIPKQLKHLTRLILHVTFLSPKIKN